MSNKEECAVVMEQRSNYAAVKDARIKPNKKEYARGTEHTAILVTNLLHLISAYDETTATLSSQRIVAVSTNKERSREPPQVILCQVTDYIEV